MKENFNIIKGIRFPRYSLKIVKFDDGGFGVIESFSFSSFATKEMLSDSKNNLTRRSSTKICMPPESLIT